METTVNRHIAEELSRLSTVDAYPRAAVAVPRIKSSFPVFELSLVMVAGLMVGASSIRLQRLRFPRRARRAQRSSWGPRG